MAREQYFRGGRAIDQSMTAAALHRIADWLDLADSRSATAVYPQLPGYKADVDLEHAWMWAALLVANMTDADSRALHALADAIVIGLNVDA